jgi:peptidyl-prolyl cis-trans isomerase A (cyclophilin A)
MLTFNTTHGDFTVELFTDAAPITAKNFLDYVDSGFFEGTIFHRVIPGFMIQGGGFTADMKQKPVNDPIKNEAKNGKQNLRGTLSMARTNDVDSATAQFFISLKDNDFLDHKPGSYGYAVFGRVVSGMETVDAIAKVKTGRRGHHDDVPADAVVINKVTRTEA